MADMEESTTEVAVTYPEVSTLPAIRPLAQEALAKLGLAVEVVERLKGYGNLVLADVTDKRGAGDLDKKRKEVKRARVAWENACKDGRADANAIADAWVKAQRTLADDFKAVEAHLDAQVELHEAWKRDEAKRVQDALRAARQKRLDDAKDADADVTIEMIDLMPDDEWDAMIGSAIISRDARRRNKAISDRLTELGDECSIEEAAELTDDQAAFRIERATDDKRARDERARIEAEEKKELERKESERLEEVARRVRELADLGIFSTFEAVSAMSDDAYSDELQKASDKREQEAEAQRERQRQQTEQQARFDRGVERCRILARLGNYEHQPDDIADLDAEAFAAMEQMATETKAKRDAETARLLKEEQDRQEAQRQAQERADEERRQEAERLERERQEALRPQREAVADWAQAALDSMPSTPKIEDPDIMDAMRRHVERARLALLDLRERMSAEPTN